MGNLIAIDDEDEPFDWGELNPAGFNRLGCFELEDIMNLELGDSSSVHVRNLLKKFDLKENK